MEFVDNNINIEAYFKNKNQQVKTCKNRIHCKGWTCSSGRMFCFDFSLPEETLAVVRVGGYLVGDSWSVEGASEESGK